MSDRTRGFKRFLVRLLCLMLTCVLRLAHRQEELTLVTSGSNHGWPFLEGTYRYRGNPGALALTAPVFTYSHDNGPRSVTGGVFHLGTRDQCKAGAFLSADLYGGGFVTELGANGWDTQEVEMRCGGPGLGCPATIRSIVGFGSGFGQTFVLTDGGVYILNDPEACGIPLGQGCAARVTGNGTIVRPTPTGTGVPRPTTSRPSGTARPTGTGTPSASPEVSTEADSGPNLVPLWATLGALAGAALLGGAGYALYRHQRKDHSEVASEAGSSTSPMSPDGLTPDTDGFEWTEANVVKPVEMTKI
jgi:hypothetical protein